MLQKEKIILWGLFLFLTFSPSLFWGDLKFIGGDDTRLYYFFHWEYLNNYALHLISDNNVSALGFYFPQSGIVPTVFLLGIFNAVASLFEVNVQLLFFGLNIGIGFLSFFFLLGNWISGNTVLRVIASVLYATSTFVYFSFYSALWPGMYLVAVGPLSIHFFAKGVMERKAPLIVLSAIVVALFGNVISAVPWGVAFFLSIVPILAYLAFYHTRRFIFSLGGFLIVFFLAGAFYFVPFFHSIFSTSGDDLNIVTRIANNSEQMIADNNSLIDAVAKHNSVLYPFFNLFHKGLQRDFSWSSYEVYEKWSMPLLPINLLFLVIMISAFFFLRRERNKGIVILYLGSFSAWLGILYGFTANIGGWGLNIFFWLNEYVPGFSMFRNMYDKFGFALAFSYAFLFAISAQIITQYLKSEFKNKVFLVIAFVLVFLNGAPFILGKNFHATFRGTESTSDRITDFNQNYYDLVEVIKTLPGSSRILWLPFARSSYVAIRDREESNHYYLGPSPLQILAAKADYTGSESFFQKGNIMEKTLDGRYNEVSSFLATMNVGYIVVNHDISEDIQGSFLYTYNQKGDIYDAQGKGFRRVLLGEKVADFGERYSLYEINKNFANEKIYVTDDTTKVPNAFDQVEYKKIASYEYKITIKGLSGKKNLVFLDPYHKQWELYFQKNNAIFLKGSHDAVFDYANGWTIDPKYIKQNFPKDAYTINEDGSLNLDLTLYFKPQSYFYLGLIISGTTLVLCLGYLGWTGVRSWRKKNVYIKP